MKIANTYRMYKKYVFFTFSDLKRFGYQMYINVIVLMYDKKYDKKYDNQMYINVIQHSAVKLFTKIHNNYVTVQSFLGLI